MRSASNSQGMIAPIRMLALIALLMGLIAGAWAQTGEPEPQDVRPPRTPSSQEELAEQVQKLMEERGDPSQAQQPDQATPPQEAHRPPPRQNPSGNQALQRPPVPSDQGANQAGRTSPVRENSAKSVKKTKVEGVKLNLRDMEVGEILKLLSEKGSFNMAIHSDVKGQLTVYLEDVPPKEALHAVCEIGNLAYIEKNDIYHSMSGQRYEQIFGRKFYEKLNTHVFKLENADPTAVLQNLQQLRSPEGKSFGDRSSQSLIVIDRREVIDQISNIIGVLDQPVETASFILRNASANELLPRLQPFVSQGGVVQADPQINGILIQDSSQAIKRLSSLIQQFDTPRLAETRSFSVAHTEPSVIMEAIKPLLTPDLGWVHADENSSKVFVSDFPERLDEVARIIVDLDSRTPEVLIEAKIIQIVLSDHLQMGVDWQFLSDTVNNLAGTGQFNVLADDGEGVRLTGGDLTSQRYEWMVEALSTIGKTNLISSPRILALNNQEASILVGSTVPYKTIDTREESGSIRTFEKVTMVDVGVKLSVTPRIHNNRFVSMKVTPEVSSVTAFMDGIPVVKTSTTTTTVMVQDGTTAIIAGLIEEEEVSTQKMVPLLGKIPLLGAIFRSTDRKIEKRELVILLTPHIKAGDEDEDWEPAYK